MNSKSKIAVIDEIIEVLNRHKEAATPESAEFIAGVYGDIFAKRLVPLENGQFEMPSEDIEDLQDHIADLISKGFTSGISPTWKLSVSDEDILDDQSTVDHIAKLVREGYREGHHPGWSIEY